jgi:hypothetical protein
MTGTRSAITTGMQHFYLYSKHRYQKGDLLEEVLIKAYVTEMSMAVVKEGNTICLELGEPDPMVLPLHPEDKRRRPNELSYLSLPTGETS